MTTTVLLRKGIQLQDRDFAILRGLFEARVMRSSHIASLFFDGRREAAKKRLQALKNAQLVTEEPRHAFEQSVLSVTRVGVEALLESGYTDTLLQTRREILNRRIRVSPLTLRHELDVMDVKLAFTQAILNVPDFELLEFNTRPAVSQFVVMAESTETATMAPITVKPDGIMRVQERTREGAIRQHTLFLEMDRSTEIQQVLITKARLYREYYRSGGFAKKLGGQEDQFRQHPFRVMIVFRSVERRDRIAEALARIDPPLLTLVWLGTLADVRDNPLGPIWIRPIDYREADTNAGMHSWRLPVRARRTELFASVTKPRCHKSEQYAI